MPEPCSDPSDLVVLLDETGRPIGTADRRTVHSAETPLHLAFSCYVFDSGGRLLITRRAAGKTFAGVWTNSVCGHPRPDEPLPNAVARRAKDELGVELDGVRLVLPDFRYRAEQDGIVENEMCPVLVATVVGTPSVEPTEVGDWMWVDWSEFSGHVATGTRPVSSWCESQVRVLRTLGDHEEDWPSGDPLRLPAAAML